MSPYWIFPPILRGFKSLVSYFLPTIVFTLITLPAHGLEFQSNVMIPMRDGVSLAANIYWPDDSGGPFPVILMRTPYGKPGADFGDAREYTDLGFAMVVQDCRGKGQSGGTWDPFVADPEDGADTLGWIEEQPWCNGRIGTAGGSYVGWTQWALMPDASPALRCAVPIVPFSHVYDDIAYYGGAFQVALLFGWGAAVGNVFLPPDELQQAYRYLPLKSWGDQFDKPVSYLNDWIRHNTDDDYWRRRSIGGRHERITVPILNIGGWYDIFSKPTLEMIMKVRESSVSRMARRNQLVIMGPWAHGVGVRKVGDLDFGADAGLDLGAIQKKWMQYWLMDEETGVEDWAPLQIFVMGANRWRDEFEWPLERTDYTPWYLHSNGQANTLNGDGVLAVTQPSATGEDSFTYDPDDPVPTSGGNNLVGAPIGPIDQSTVESRQDVLVYTSDVLNTPVEVTGPVKAVLYVSSSARDTDFTAKLVDVHPDGRAFNLCDGIRRVRFRTGMNDEQLIRPGEKIRLEIDLWVTSNLFLKGHRIRLEVSSSNFPRFDRNPNSGLPFGTDVEVIKAQQTVFHGPEHPSHVLLPIIPARN